MIRIIKLTAFILVSFVFLFAAVAAKVFAIAFRGNEKIVLAHLTSVWAKILLFILNIDVNERIVSKPRPFRNYLFVANHQSYLDIIVMASLYPTLFVAKKEVKSWALLGWLATLGGTLYIDRATLRGGVYASIGVAQYLEQGVNVQIFPEGTSTDGSTVLPFKPFLFKAAFDTGKEILPVTINYLSINNQLFNTINKDIVCWYGNMEFIEHFWNVLRQKSMRVSVVTHAPIHSHNESSLQMLAQSVHQKVVAGRLVQDEIQVKSEVENILFTEPVSL